MLFDTTHSPYSYIWHKYRPVILRLMINAADAPQQYTFSDHEFRRINPKNRSSLAFILYVHRSKAMNNIKASPLANALLGILRESRTALTLTESSTYELMLDDKFVLHVRKNSPVEEKAEASATVTLAEENGAAKSNENIGLPQDVQVSMTSPANGVVK